MAIIGIGLGTSNAAVAVLGGVAVPFARFSGTPTCGSFLGSDVHVMLANPFHAVVDPKRLPT